MILKGGMVLPLESVQLALRLESEGFKFRLDHAGQLEIAPAAHLSDDDRIALRRWRRHVAMLLAYQSTEDEVAGSGFEFLVGSGRVDQW